MTEKAKRKHAPFNTRKYWITYSIIALLLLIPFRIVGEWWLTTTMFAVISGVLFIALLRFIRRYHWKRPLVVLMLVCALLPIGQIILTTPYTYACEVSSTNGLIAYVSCNIDCSTWVRYGTLRGIPAIGVELGKSWVFVWCLW